MHSILHKIVVESSPENLFQAIESVSGLSSWWTKAEKDGKKISLFFGPGGEHQVMMEMTSVVPGQEISWKCVSGPWEEKGDFVFRVSEHERGACLDFSHHGWPETDDFYKHCNAKWGFFLAVSLKQYLETGSGQPHPNDPNI